MSGISKRDFLKKISVVSLATAASTVVHAESNELTSKKKPIVRTLGRTGLKVPIISSGRVSLDNDNLVRALFKSEIIHFDSGLVYAEGKADMKIGQMIKEFGRKKYIIASKVKLDFDFTEKKFLSEDIGKEFSDKLEQILKMMDVEYLDILYVHDVRCSLQVNHPAVIAAVQKAKDLGKARFIGMSSHEGIKESVDAACDAKIYDIALLSYNIRSGQDVKDAFARAAAEGMGTIAMKTMAGYWLDKEKTIPINRTAALKYVLQDENVHTVIKGFSTFDEINLFMPLLYDIKMTPQEKTDIETALNYAGLYCKGCGQCRPLCPKGLSIPDLMRGYMYTYGYGEPSRGRALVLRNNIHESTCDDCETCLVKCSMGFPIAERIRDIARLRNVPGDFLA